jgi:hypothetical protein
MKKITTIMCLIITAISLSSCSQFRKAPRYDEFWEREQLTSSLYMRGDKAKGLLDRDLAECLTTVQNRQNLEENSLNTKRCETRDGEDWSAVTDKTFVRQCMQRKGWIPSNCCALKKGCTCN